MTKTVELSESVVRSKSAVKCSCGGYAEEREATDDEERKYGCGRRGCCSAAFVCAICGTRHVGYREAPEME